MHLEGYQDVLLIITYGLAIVMLSALADWKNRNFLAWGLIGGLFFPTSFIYLLFDSHLCRKCKAPLTKDQWRLRRCPTCGDLAKKAGHDGSSNPAREEPL